MTVIRTGVDLLCSLPWPPEAMTYVEDLGIVCIRAGERPLLVQIANGVATVCEIEITEQMVH